MSAIFQRQQGYFLGEENLKKALMISRDQENLKMQSVTSFLESNRATKAFKMAIRSDSEIPILGPAMNGSTTTRVLIFVCLLQPWPLEMSPESSAGLGHVTCLGLWDTNNGDRSTHVKKVGASGLSGSSMAAVQTRLEDGRAQHPKRPTSRLQVHVCTRAWPVPAASSPDQKTCPARPADLRS